MAKGIQMQFVGFLSFAILIAIISTAESLDGKNKNYPFEFPWTWTCNLETIDGPSCERQKHNASSGAEKVPLNICWLTCGPHGSLWPYPSGTTSMGKTLTGFVRNNLSENITASTEVRTMVEQALDIFKGYVNTTIPEGTVEPSLANTVEIRIHVNTNVTKITLETDESYSLQINQVIEGGIEKVTVSLSAETYFGIRHGFETLGQLIDFNGNLNHLQIVNNVSLEDKPVFKYRGLLVDTGRNFYPFDSLRRLVDGLSYNKMNVFHWHITDSNSFPFYSKSVPKMTEYGAFDNKKIYLPQDITEFINYANLRGVKIVVELDAPSHAGNGWNWSEDEGLGLMSLCVNAQPYRDYCIQPPCGQLNPLNDYMYGILGEIYSDMLEIFDRDIFHQGGDEISFTCWLSSSEITDWMIVNNSTDLMDLWGRFQTTAYDKLKIANGGNHIDSIVWTSEMTNRARQYLPAEDYIIQIWSTSKDEVIKDILNENYRVIFSNNNTMYLDHGFGPWRGTENKAPMIFWQTLYGHDILQLVKDLVGDEAAQKFYDDGKLFGGEANLWSEKTDPLNVDQKMWPRGAALGERLWSNPDRKTRDAYPRLIHHRERMVARGIEPDTLLPEACYHIWGFCDDPDPLIIPDSKSSIAAAISPFVFALCIFLLQCTSFFCF